MSRQRIRELARGHVERALCRGTHLRVAPDVYAWMRELAPAEPAVAPLWLGWGGLITGISIVVEPDLPAGAWQLDSDTPPHDVMEWGYLGDAECEHSEPADVTTVAHAPVRIHWCCPCGAHWFQQVTLDYQPVQEPAPAAQSLA